MVNDKMCVGVEKDRIMVRFDPDRGEEVLQKPGAQPMDFTGKVMRGYAFVDESALKTKQQLQYWVNLALDHKKKAKESK